MILNFLYFLCGLEHEQGWQHPKVAKLKHYGWISGKNEL